MATTKDVSGSRKVVYATTSEVAHVWASGDRAEGRTSNGSLSFRGDTLYSYDAAIAIIVREPGDSPGEPAAILSRRAYSNTTSRHQGEARSAVRHLRVVSVPFFLNENEVGGWHKYGGAPAIRPRFAKSIAKLQAGWERSLSVGGRVRGPKARLAAWDALSSEVESANAYCAVTGEAPFPVPELTPERAAEIEARRRLNRAERDARDRRSAARFADQYVARVAVHAERAERDKGRIAEWVAGGSPGEFVTEVGRDYLRVSPSDPETVQTSRGATVPTHVLRRLAPGLLEAVRAGVEWRPDREFRVGLYRLDRVDSSGAVYVGCHRFERAEVERFAAIILGGR